MRIVTGTLKSTPTTWLPILANLAPAHLRRTAAAHNEWSKISKHPPGGLPIQHTLDALPPNRLNSRHPIWRDDQLKEDFDMASKWGESLNAAPEVLIFLARSGAVLTVSGQAMGDVRTCYTGGAGRNLLNLPVVAHVMGTYEKEQERLQMLLDEVGLDDENINIYDDESDEGEQDLEETLNHESESEQEISDRDDDDMSNSTSLSFIDAKSYWKKHAPKPKTVRTRRENLVIRLPGPTLATKLLQSPAEIWNYFFDVYYRDSTNKYIVSCQDNFSRVRDANLIGKYAVFWTPLAGVTHANRLNTEDLWRRDGYGVEILHLTMSLQRFRFLVRVLRFDDKDTRLERMKTNKLAPIRTVFESFVANCQTGYYLSAFITVDEILAGFRGRCSFRQYIPSKPNKYGLKILVLCDAKMFYTSKLEVYIGSQPDGPFKISNSPKDVVLRLCEHVFASCRNVTMHNWFTSIPLVETLLHEYKLTVIGTVRKKQTRMEFSKPTNRPARTSMFGFTNDQTIVSYIPKKGKNVILVSSFHHHARFSCFKCNTYMCLEHITAICKPCRESALQDQ
ncbi:hypothetical protein NQ318_000593 [Aromia moschata]|uniref:PiggyBac transposable element-derived protein domain-containing protein n=1 Tax=Aromia moschata TaxID=1265417 RepID=A0AAV8XRM6_9CUCU|nr:hypothetical protein NQ318_000593 [Aromia moschata]